jgi:hypothetical protein
MAVINVAGYLNEGDADGLYCRAQYMYDTGDHNRISTFYETITWEYKTAFFCCH